MSAPTFKIGIVAPSSVVSPQELFWGLELISRRAKNLEIRVHEQCYRSDWFFAGTDQERTQAFAEYAWDASLDILWTARGGYGAHRLLESLEWMTRERGVPPKKLLIGYSDSSALLEFARRRWGWSVLHAVMPGHRGLLELSPAELAKLFALIQKKKTPLFKKRSLKFLGERPKKAITGTLIGGNLSVITALAGTPFALQAKDKILFLEDVTESPSRIDRMVGQLVLTGQLDEIRAVVLGTFTSCEDASPVALAKVKTLADAQKAVRRSPLKPAMKLRERFEFAECLEQIFRTLYVSRKIPVAYGLSVGHGAGHDPLPLDAEYTLKPEGSLDLLRWNWFER